MELDKSRAQGIGCLIALVVIGVAGLLSVLEPEPTVSDAAPAPEITILREQGMTGDYALTIPAGLAAEKLPGIAKEQCGARSHCSVYGWTDPAQTARALPLTEPEFESLAFRYDLNRSTGFERSSWDCERFPQPDTASCL